MFLMTWSNIVAIDERTSQRASLLQGSKLSTFQPGRVIVRTWKAVIH